MMFRCTVREAVMETKTSNPWIEKAEQAFDSSDYEGALNAAKEGATEDSRNAEAWAWQGLALVHRLRNEEAEAVLTHATVLDDNLAVAWSLRGRCSKELG